MTMAEGGWGEPADSQGPSLSLHRDVGGDITVDLDPQAIHQLLHSDEVRQAVAHYADQLAAEANALALHVGEADRPDPHYAAAGGTVYPQNYQARLDDAINSTLFKIMAAHTDE